MTAIRTGIQGWRMEMMTQGLIPLQGVATRTRRGSCQADSR
jgi:hypothetical protein